MSIKRVLDYVALTAVVALSGCGTMANIEGRRLPSPGPSGQEVSRPFGGVRKDIEWLHSEKAPGNLKYAADLPLSLVGDIVTLPRTVTGMQSDRLLQDGSGPDQPPSYLGGGARPDAAP
jgi:uncharacterized protein YceK